MKFCFWRLITTLLLVGVLSACTSIDVLNVSGSKGDSVAVAGTINHRLGDTPIRIVVTGSGGFTLVALHENESTSVAAARQVMQTTRGTLIELKHTGAREITFSLQGKRYSIDPNRMFTDAGIRTNLKGGHSTDAHNAVKRLAGEVVSRLGRRVIVALHNNTDGRYSVLSYQPGGQYARDARSVYVNPSRDPDDFFFVTSKRLFDALKQAGHNVVLQSQGVTDDGSLSVYAARKGIPYVNVEAQNGHLPQQIEMLRILLE